MDILVDEQDRHLLDKSHYVENGYVKVYLGYEDGKPRYTLLHQLIMGVKGCDHRNGNGLDNRRENLRVATATEQQANKVKRPGTQSQYKGVSPSYDKWKARINKNGKRTFLGYFAAEEDAAKAYDKAAREMFGEFAAVNFPEEGERGC